MNVTYTKTRSRTCRPVRWIAAALASGCFMVLAGATYAQTPAPTPAPAQKQILQVETGATGANSNNNYTPAPVPGPVAKPTPGTMVIHMNGSARTQFGVGGP